MLHFASNLISNKRQRCDEGEQKHDMWQQDNVQKQESCLLLIR